ncbi:MAG TPA: hypothetical protein VF646_12215 [Cytophagales bacterium]
MRTLFSLVLLLSFLTGSAVAAFASEASAQAKGAVQKGTSEQQAVVKPSVSPEAMVSAVSIKFHQVCCDFFRQFVLLTDPVRVTEARDPVFRHTYFAKVFSHLIVAKAP